MRNKNIDRNELETQAEMAIASLLVEHSQLESTEVLRSICRIMWITGFDSGCKATLSLVSELAKQ